MFWVLKKSGEKNSVLASETLDFEVPLTCTCCHTVLLVEADVVKQLYISKLRWPVGTKHKHTPNTESQTGGAGSEVWNRVYMIAPVKKFGRVRLSTNFPSKQIWRRRWWVFARFYVLRRSNIKKRFSWSFIMKFLDIRRRDVWTVHEWLRSSWFGTLASSVIYKLREFSSDQPQGSLLHLLYIFSPTVVLRTLCLILNICYELIIVWVLQQSYGNVH